MTSSEVFFAITRDACVRVRRIRMPLDRRGATLQEEIDIPFPRIELTIRVTTASTQSQIEMLERDLPRFCAVSKVIRESGTSIVSEWIVLSPD